MVLLASPKPLAAAVFAHALSIPFSLPALAAPTPAKAVPAREEAPPYIYIPPPVMPPPPYIYIAPPPPPLSPDVRRMIEAAIAGDDPAVIANVLSLARKISPREARADIAAIETRWKTDVATRKQMAEEARLAMLRAAGPLDNWKGDVEFGAFRSTGNSSNLGVLGSLNLSREGIDWTHKLIARADVQTTDGETTAERILASWQPNYRMNERTYAFGLVQYEHDPFAGYDSRYTLGGGIGYKALTGKRLQLDLEGGPALRRADEVGVLADAAGPHTELVGRGSLNLKWQVTPTLSLNHQTAVYLESEDSNATATTALDTKVIGNLKARFSYNIQYEGAAPPGTKALNTQSRVTFVYGF